MSYIKPVYSEFIRVKMLKLRDMVTRHVSQLAHPNAITIVGLVINALAGVFFGYDFKILAALTIVLAGAMDILDGSVAKYSGKITKFGGFLDSTIDRYSDVALYVGILVLFFKQQNIVLCTFTLSAIIGSFMISYTRARSESIIGECKIGFWERPERIVYILLGCLFNNIGMVMIVLGIFTHVTALARIKLTYDTLEKTSTKSTIIAKIFFWEYQRYTLAYDLKVIVLILLLFIKNG